DEEGDDDDQDEADDANEEDEEEAEEERDPFATFLVRFKTALHAIYESEAAAAQEDPEHPGKAQEQLEDRLRAITLFRPLDATVPSMEEAQSLARRAEAQSHPTRIRRPSLRPSPPRIAPAGPPSGRAGSAGGAGGGGGSGGGGAAAPLKGAARAAMIVKSEGRRAQETTAAGSPAPPPEWGGEERLAPPEESAQIPVADADVVDPVEVISSELNEKIRFVARLLATVEPLDQLVWTLLLDPMAAVKDCRALARVVGTASTPARQAYQAVREIARHVSLRSLLHLPGQVVRRERNLVVEISAFMNNARSSRSFEADSRQLAPLPRILEHAVGALIRLEALKTNHYFTQQHPDRYSPNAVTVYYEEALRGVTGLVEAQLRAQVRQQADADTRTLAGFFEAERYVTKVLDTATAYGRAVRDAGADLSLEALRAYIATTPLELPSEAEPVTVEEMPPEVLAPSGLGEAFDELCAHVIGRAWAVMQPVHQPVETARRLREALRQVVVRALIVAPEMRRHQERPAIALAVASLDKVTGSPALKQFYVRVREDGHLAYLDSFEDGSYVDLFELREYKPSRVHLAVRQQAQEEGTEELQTGRKYLFTVGRTNSLFWNTPSELINSCIRSAEGGPVIFPVF
ncbi:MAG: hypothetical protein AB1505_26790, partial [Candidatus Latescibacterota bacterium]